MAIITILGLILKQDDYNKRALYSYDKNIAFTLKKQRYTNMLPLLMDNFDDKIIPIYTKDAKSIQQKVLKSEFDGDDFADIFRDDYLLTDVDEEGYTETFKIMNNAINEEEENIIDLSHGFRHLPILATISLIVNNIENTNKIKYIFFAKEIIPREKYEIIDLKNYLELANISYLLATFNQNYTISGNMKFSNPLYQKLADELKKFSEHFLSNSLKIIINGNMIDNILKTFDKLKAEEDILNLNNFIVKIKLHLTRIRNIRNRQQEHDKFYEIAKIMDERGYQLNAITLLFEALGYYCLDSIYRNTNKTKVHIDKFKNFIEEKNPPRNVYSDYTLTNQSRNIVKLQRGFKNDFLFNPETINWSKDKLKNTKYQNIPRTKTNAIKYEIIYYLNNISRQELKQFQRYIVDMEALRNNLTHGNSSDEVENIEKLFAGYVEKFDDFVIKKDVLKK